jgi:hypothetical protein
MVSTTVKTAHPLTEIIGRKLFGIESVPKEEMRNLIRKCIKEVINYHEEEINKLKEENE